MSKLAKEIHSKSKGAKSSKKGEHKAKGEQANGKSLSDSRQKPMPRTLGRGIGSSYAFAVESVLDQSRNSKGSSTSFLGKEKVSIETKELAGKDVLYKGKNKERK